MKKRRPAPPRRVFLWALKVEPHPKTPTLTVRYDRAAKSKQVIKDFGRLLTLLERTWRGAERGSLAIKVNALSVHPEDERERRLMIVQRERALRRKTMQTHPDIDLRKLYIWQLRRLKSKVKPPSNAEIVQGLREVCGLAISRDTVKNIRSIHYRHWFYPDEFTVRVEQ